MANGKVVVFGFSRAWVVDKSWCVSSSGLVCSLFFVVGKE